MGACERKGKAESGTRGLQMQLRPYKASAHPAGSGTNAALSRPALGLYPPDVSASLGAAAQEGLDLGPRTLLRAASSSLSEDRRQASAPAALRMVLLVLDLPGPQCVGRASWGQ